MPLYLSRDGNTLLPVLVVMLVLVLLSTTIGTLTSHCYYNVIKEEYHLRSFHAAEAGIETTIAKIKAETSWYNNFPASGGDNYVPVIAETVLDGQVSYEVKAYKYDREIGTSMHLQSVGRYRAGDGQQKAQATLQSTIGVYQAGDYFRGLAVLPNNPVDMNLGGNLVLDGDLLVNGSARIAGSTNISGTAYASGSITGTWLGSRQSRYLYIPQFPLLDVEYYLINAAAAGQVYNTDTSFGACGVTAGVTNSETDNENSGIITEFNGFYFVDGDITIGGVYRGTALLFATGNITVLENLEPDFTGEDDLPGTDNGGLVLAAQGDIDIQNHIVYAHILAGECLRANSGAVLHGAACSRDIDFLVAGNQDVIQILYGENPAPLNALVPVNTKMVEWSELHTIF